MKNLCSPEDRQRIKNQPQAGKGPYNTPNKEMAPRTVHRVRRAWGLRTQREYLRSLRSRPWSISTACLCRQGTAVKGSLGHFQGQRSGPSLWDAKLCPQRCRGGEDMEGENMMTSQQASPGVCKPATMDQIQIGPSYTVPYCRRQLPGSTGEPSIVQRSY